MKGFSVVYEMSVADFLVGQPTSHRNEATGPVHTLSATRFRGAQLWVSVVEGGILGSSLFTE